MKKLANLKGVKTLNRNEQKEIYGGIPSLSCSGKSAGDLCGTASSPGYICCTVNPGPFSYLHCRAPQFCNTIT